MSLYDDDYDPAYSHRITNIYYEDDPWNQKKLETKRTMRTMAILLPMFSSWLAF